VDVLFSKMPGLTLGVEDTADLMPALVEIIAEAALKVVDLRSILHTVSQGCASRLLVVDDGNLPERMSSCLG